MKHNVNILVQTKNGREELLKTKHLKFREKLMRAIFGDFCEVIVLNPSKQISQIQIKEAKNESEV